MVRAPLECAPAAHCRALPAAHPGGLLRWYAHGLSWVGVPLWLPPLHGLFAHWVLDAYWLVTLRDARKATLP